MKTPEASINVGSWNVHTHLDSKTNKPKRRAAHVARHLNRYNIHIAVLSETRLAKFS